MLAFLAGNVLQFPYDFSAFWAPTGVGLVALLLAPKRWWWGIILWLTLLDVMANRLMFDVLAWPDDGIKVALAAYIFRRFNKEPRFRIRLVNDYVIVLASSAAAFSIVSIFSAPSHSLWVGFWMGDLLGVTMIAPVVLLVQRPSEMFTKIESVVTLLILFSVARALFFVPQPVVSTAYEIPYLILPFLLWISIRLPDTVVATGAIGVAAIVVYYTGSNLGPFLALPVSTEEQFLMLQSYLLIVTTGPVLLSLGLHEQKVAAGESSVYSKVLVESRQLYQQLFETSGLAIAVLEKSSVVQMNRRLLQIFSLEVEDEILKLAPKFQPDGRESTAVADELLAQADVEGVSTVWVGLGKDGQPLDLQLTLFSLPNRSRTVLTFIDITSSRKLLRMLKAQRESLAARVEARSNELVKANAALSNSARARQVFVAHLSHELRTPLTGLLAQTATLLEGLYGELNEKQNQSVVQIRNNGERLSRLIVDLLDLHRLEAGMVKVRKNTIPVKEVTQSVLEELDTLRQRRRVHCSIECESDAQVHIDVNLFRRVLSLLLGRALRQTPIGESCGVKIENWPDLGQVELTVWDTGSPISARVKASLSDPYALRSEDENRLETGLGLAVADRLLRLLGSKLEIRESKKGTLIALTLGSEKL